MSGITIESDRYHVMVVPSRAKAIFYETKLAMRPNPGTRLDFGK